MSVYAPALGYIWKNAKEFGLDPDELFKEAGIDPGLRLDTSARVGDRQVNDLIWIAKKQSKDKDFIFALADHLHPSYLGALGYAWLTSFSLRKSFKRLEKYAHLVSDAVDVDLKDRENELNIIFNFHSVDSHHPALLEDEWLITSVKLCRMNCGESFSPARVCFQQPTPSNLQTYQWYFRCELIFDSESTALAIPSAIADEPLPGFNAQIVHHLDQMIVDYLAQQEKLDIVGRTKAEIAKELPTGDISMEAVASALGVSLRTLSRKLKDEGESFKKLLITTRQELSEQYIQDKSLSTTEISFLLGFSETSSFSRAYKSWNGLSPSAHREAMAQPNPSS
jgi:AraC-like DNA-binding protein